MRRAQTSAQSSNAGATAPSVLADDTDERSATQCKRRRAQTSAQSSDADDTHESSQAIVTDEQSTARTDDTDEQAQQSHARTTDPSVTSNDFSMPTVSHAHAMSSCHRPMHASVLSV